jgi:hypothetical protein
MAVRYYGVAVGGQNPPNVTISASTTGEDIELAVDDTNLAAGSIDKRLFVEIAIQAILQAVNEDTGL